MGRHSAYYQINPKSRYVIKDHREVSQDLEIAAWDSYPLGFLQNMTNLFLVRNPKQLIASFAQVISEPSMQDIGLKKSWELFNKIENQNPVVLDSAEILKDPQSLLNKLCDRLGINFYTEMLSWPVGGIKEDGAWAEYWYKNVHNSTGFTKQKTSSRELPKHCESLYLEALKIVKQERKASTSFIQRKLQIGYNRAARIIDMMEEEGIVSKANHVGKRDVF